MIYMVGQWDEESEFKGNWQVIGLFDDKGDALRACRTPDHFIMEIEKNKDLGDTTEEWDAEYPVAAEAVEEDEDIDPQMEHDMNMGPS